MNVCLLLLAILPNDGIVREQVDAIEVNSFYQVVCEEAEVSVHKLVFQQVIFRAWNNYFCEHEIVAWRMAKPGMEPRYDHARQVWVMDWLDSGVHRRVEAKTMYVTNTEHDPEVTERNVLPADKRRGLIKK